MAETMPGTAGTCRELPVGTAGEPCLVLASVPALIPARSAWRLAVMPRRKQAADSRRTASEPLPVSATGKSGAWVWPRPCASNGKVSFFHGRLLSEMRLCCVRVTERNVHRRVPKGGCLEQKACSWPPRAGFGAAFGGFTRDMDILIAAEQGLSLSEQLSAPLFFGIGKCAFGRSYARRYFLMLRALSNSGP